MILEVENRGKKLEKHMDSSQSMNMRTRAVNVLVLAQYFPPDMGGGATRAQNAVNGLLKAGCTVTVISAFPHYPAGNVPSRYRWKPLDIAYESELKVIRTYVPALASKGFGNRILLFVSFIISSLFAFPFVGKIDVVWAANPNIVSFFPGLIYKIIERCPLVQNVDDLWPEALYDLGLPKKSFLARLGEFTARIAYRFASAITPISPAYTDIIATKYDAGTAKVHVVRAGVDLEQFSYETTTSEDPEKKFRVLYIGSFSPAYDFDQVFRAAKLLTSHSDLEFVIQGGGELVNSLKSKVRQMGLQNTKIIDRIVPRQEVAKILGEADALLLPLSGVGSIELGISSKLYEYQAAKKPIICCSNGQPAHYVLETKSGLVVEPGDHKKLANSILYLRKNQSVAEELGKSGRTHVEENLSIQQIGVKMRGILEEALVSGRRI